MKLLKRNSIAILIWTGIVFSQQSINQVYGFITDSTSGEALIGANVFIRESGQGMATDNNGYYVLSNIAIQEAQLVVSYVGYKRYEKSINFSEISSQNYNIALQPESIELMQVDVTAEEIERLNKIGVRIGYKTKPTVQVVPRPGEKTIGIDQYFVSSKKYLKKYLS